MRPYTPSELVVGIVLFDQDLRSSTFYKNNFDVTPENIDLVRRLQIQETYVVSVPVSDPETTQNVVMVRDSFTSGSHYFMDLNNPEHKERCVFHPFSGLATAGFIDCCEFFKRLRLKEQEFVDAGKRDRYFSLWKKFFEEIQNNSLQRGDGKILRLTIEKDDFKVTLT